MNLLILTQKVDRNDDVLGFFHGWIRKFAQRFDVVTVICLKKGEYELSANVKVFSLGKEEGVSRLTYVARFYRYIWKERHNYDAVFVHMNEEYVLLGGLVWRLMGKKVLMWRNHLKGSLLTRVAVWLTHRAFCTSPQSFTAQFKKTKLMPVGIDTDFFVRNKKVTKEPRSILFFGRISTVKKPEVFIEACRLLKIQGTQFVARIVGSPNPRDEGYYQSLQKTVEEKSLDDVVIFSPGIPNIESPDLYSRNEIYVNATPSGSFDKTILEALSCGAISVTCNTSVEALLDGRFVFKDGDSADLAAKLSTILDYPDTLKQSVGEELRRKVQEAHSIDLLVDLVHEEVSL